MFKLQKRYTSRERRLPVVVIDLQNDSAMEYLIKIFGKNTYLWICKQADNYKSYWLVVYEDQIDYWLYSSLEEIMKDYRNFSMFDENEKSTFKYWFAHWCAFQLTALNLKIWKFKYLFHDIEKPWLKLFWTYKKVQKWHRKHNRHHLEYGLEHGWDAIDWEALMIDWECSQLSKKQCPLNCREEMENKLSEEKWKPYEQEIKKFLLPLLNKLFL